MWDWLQAKTRLPSVSEVLPGRDRPMPLPPRHFVLDAPLDPELAGLDQAMFGLGCFWGAERRFWQLPGVVTTAVGYAGGFTPNPTYEEVCSGRTGHSEVVRVVYDPERLDYRTLLRLFWESHDPTQGMRQGNDVGTQYRSALYVYGPEQKRLAEASRDAFQRELTARGRGTITTELIDAPPFYFAEEYHQQYLAKNPNGYCGLEGTGVRLPEI